MNSYSACDFDIHFVYYTGNNYIHMLTSSGKYELRVDMVDKNNKTIYAVYKTFVVGDSASKYKLTVGGYSGNAGELFQILLVFQQIMKTFS